MTFRRNRRSSNSYEPEAVIHGQPTAFGEECHLGGKKKEGRKEKDENVDDQSALRREQEIQGMPEDQKI